MPASSTDSCDPIEQILQDSFINNENGCNSRSLDKQLLSSAKKVFLSKVEFQPAEKEYSFALQNLKAKYTYINPNGEQAFKKLASVEEMNSSIVNTINCEDDGIPSPNIMIYPPNKVTLGWQRVYRIGAGLANLGNTCFLNSTLQCLTYTPPLVNHLIEFDEHVTNCKNVGFCMMCELHRHIRRALEKNGEIIKPQCILQKLKAIAKHMVWGRQEDAHEFLRYVMESMIKASMKEYTTSSLDRISLETTVVNHIFGGYHRSQVICLRCKEKSDTYDHFMDIILDIKNVSSLEKALGKFIQPEILDNENSYMCPKCKRKCPAQKIFTIHRAPNIATFQLKRFDYNRMIGGKITKHVTFPEKLNMRPYMSQSQGTCMMYQLYAVLVHQGISCNSGHYFCFVRNSNNLWYIMDDCKVRQVSLNFVLGQQAYLLFYTRIPNNAVLFTKKCNSQSSLSAVHINSKVNGFTSYCLENISLSTKKSTSNGCISSSIKPLNSPSITNIVISPTFTALSQNREPVSFGIKPPSWKQNDLMQKKKLCSHQNSFLNVEENHKHPRIVMHIKNGKVTNLEQQSSSSSAIVEKGTIVNGSASTLNEPTNLVGKLVPYIPDSSEESDNDYKMKKSILQHNDAQSSVDNLKLSECEKKSEQALLTNHPLRTSIHINVLRENHHSLDKSIENNGKHFLNEQNKPLAVLTSGNKVKATSAWMVTDCQQSPSVASEGSNNSVNSTSGWKIIDRDKEPFPKLERHYAGWTVTPKDKEKLKLSYSKNGDLSNFSCDELYDDSSKLLKQQSSFNMVKHHSDTEADSARKKIIKSHCSLLSHEKKNLSHNSLKCQKPFLLKESDNVSSVDCSEELGLVKLSNGCSNSQNTPLVNKSDDTDLHNIHHAHTIGSKRTLISSNDNEHINELNRRLQSTNVNRTHNSSNSSQRNKKKKKKHKRCYDERNSSASSSDYELEWVERTKETLEKEKMEMSKKLNLRNQNTPNEHISSNKTYGTNSREKDRDNCIELYNQSLHSYGNRVITWNGECNQIDRDNGLNLKQKRRFSDDYDDEYDASRTRKLRFHKKKHMHYEKSYNPFQHMQDKRCFENKYPQDKKNSSFSSKLIHYGRTKVNKFKHLKDVSKFKYHKL